jgi:hypothetical protein
MLHGWGNDHWRSALILVKRLVNTRSAVHLGNEMKMLNDKKQFRQALHLFDTCRERDPEIMLSSMIITQALKACTHTRDLDRGVNIHRLVAARSREDTYILASLIHLYSKARRLISFQPLCIAVQCGEIGRAESLFAESKSNVPSLYGAMMKGEFLYDGQLKSMSHDA